MYRFHAESQFMLFLRKRKGRIIMTAFVIIAIVLALIYAGFIVHATGFLTIEDMKTKFWSNQPIVGKVLLTAFYLPACPCRLLSVKSGIR